MTLGKKYFVAVFAFVVLAITSIVFSTNVKNERCYLDDNDYLFYNVHIADGLTPSVVRWAFTDVGYAQNWHPLTWMSHAADVSIYRLFDSGSSQTNGNVINVNECSFLRFVHAENIFLHGLNAVLLFLLLLMFTGNIPVSVVFTLLWALHPLRVEVVAWASERKELLSVFLLLVTLLTYFCKSKIHSFAYICSVIAFLLALLAKPVAVSLPAALLAIDVLIERRRFSRALFRVLPFIFLSACVCLLTMLAQKGALSQGAAFHWTTRLICAIEAPIVYAGQTFWPFGLSTSYSMPVGMLSATFVSGILFLLAMLCLVALWLFKYAIKQRQSVSIVLSIIAIAWCYIGLLPMLGVVKVGYQPHSDRYTYWIGCGVAFCCSCGVAELLRRYDSIRNFRTCLLSITSILLLLLGITTHLRSEVWHRTFDLMREGVLTSFSEDDMCDLALYMQTNIQKYGLETEDLARRVLAVRHSGYARSILAFVIATIYSPESGDDRINDIVPIFQELRLLARYAIEDENNFRKDMAFAALGLFEYKSKNYDTSASYFNEAIAQLERSVRSCSQSETLKTEYISLKKLAEAEASKDK